MNTIMWPPRIVVLPILLIVVSILSPAQSIPTDSATEVSSPVPRLMKYTGSAPEGTVSVRFAIYGTEDGTAPLWVETQNVVSDQTGHYTVLLGAMSADGLPASIFASGEARWIGVTVGAGGESARTLLVSVPYALKAGDAETLGGKPLSAFVLTDAGSAGAAPTVTTSSKALRLKNAPDAGKASPENFGTGDTGTLNFVGKFSADGADAPLVASQIFDDGTHVGIGTTTPHQQLELTGNLRLPPTNGSTGIVYQGPNLMIHTAPFNSGNLFVGVNAGNLTNSGSSNLGIGSVALNSLTTGNFNMALGAFALSNNQTGNQSTAIGSQALFNATANNNTGIGFNALVSTTSGAANTGIGTTAGQSNTTGIFNTFLGYNTNASAGGLTNATAIGANAIVSASNALILGNGANVGIGTSAPGSDTMLNSIQGAAGIPPGSFTVGNPLPSAVHGDTVATSGVITGILGTTSSLDGYGVMGENLSSGQGSGFSAGVRGITVNTNTFGTGVWGDALQSGGDNVGVFGRSASAAGTGVFGQATSVTGDVVGVYGTTPSTGGTGIFGEATASSAASSSLFPVGVYGRAANAGAAGLFDVLSGPANVLVGRQNGTNVFRVDATGKGFFFSGTQTGGADFAESVNVAEEKSAYEPGDVIAIDTTGLRRFTKVSQRYSTLVAGIYSTKPGVLATKHVDDPRIDTEEIPLAVVGIVPCKVTNENGVINAGDLLVSSSTAGFAMKGTDRSKMTGAVLGKALGSMHARYGMIEVLVSLQ